MTVDEIRVQIIQKQGELIDLLDLESIDVAVSEKRKKRARKVIASLRQQLEKLDNKPLTHKEAQKWESKMGF
jgi:hypothetical protein